MSEMGPKDIRGHLGLSVPEWTAVLGVGHASVYRWEAAAAVKIDPGTARIYRLLGALPPSRLSEIGAGVRYELIRRGGLHALLRLLSEALK
jgi:hypothetical protein